MLLNSHGIDMTGFTYVYCNLKIVYISLLIIKLFI